MAPTDKTSLPDNTLSGNPFAASPALSGEVTVFGPPRYVGDGPRVRNVRHPFQWVKAGSGYRRKWSWHDLETGKCPSFTLADAKALGHTRETWDGGYVRSRTDAVRPGFRYGHLVIESIDGMQTRARCDCGNVSRPWIGSLITGGTLSCGGCRSLHPMDTDERLAGVRLVRAACGCWHCTAARWESCHAA